MKYKLSIKQRSNGEVYQYIDNSKVIARASAYDYRSDNFDWILIADVETDPDYRHQGLASSLVDEIYKNYCVGKPIGAYLVVRVNNYPAIQMYKKLGFHIVKVCEIDKEKYYVYAKGAADKNQLKKMEFGG